MKKKFVLIILILILVLALVWLVDPGIIGRVIEVISPATTTSTTTSTTTPLTTTTAQTTTTTTLVTTTIQVRKPISIMAYSCARETDIITLTISNKGNTRIEEDEIEIYINDEYIGIFDTAIEPGRLGKNSIQGNPGLNVVKAVSPSNSVRLVIYCY